MSSWYWRDYVISEEESSIARRVKAFFCSEEEKYQDTIRRFRSVCEGAYLIWIYETQYDGVEPSPYITIQLNIFDGLDKANCLYHGACSMFAEENGFHDRLQGFVADVIPMIEKARAEQEDHEHPPYIDRIEEVGRRFRSHRIVHASHPDEPVIFALYSLGGGEYDDEATHFKDLFKRLDSDRLRVLIEGVKKARTNGVVIEVYPLTDYGGIEFNLKLGQAVHYNDAIYSAQDGPYPYQETVDSFIESIDRYLSQPEE